MSLRNTEKSYGSVAKWLHWLTALLFLFSYVTVYYRHWFTESGSSENWTALQLHLSIGVSIAVVVSLRIFWRVLNKQPQPEPGNRLEHMAATLGHYALYAVMIMMPITGYLGTGAATEFFYLFEIPKFEDTALFQSIKADNPGLIFKEFEKPFDYLHKNIGGKWLVWILILGHAAAAMYHHFVKRDRTLRKMTFDKKAREPEA